MVESRLGHDLNSIQRPRAAAPTWARLIQLSSLLSRVLIWYLWIYLSREVFTICRKVSSRCMLRVFSLFLDFCLTQDSRVNCVNHSIKKSFLDPRLHALK